MVQKLILSFLLCLASALPALAQFENVSDEDRLGGPKKRDANYNYYKQFNAFRDRFRVPAKDADGNIMRDENGNEMLSTDFKLAPDEWPCDSIYECWRRLYDGAPFFTVNTYIQGATILDSMAIHAKKSEAERLMYFQDLMQIYEDRIRRNDSLNSTIKNEKARSKRSAVMAKAADVYYHTAPLVKGSGYTPEKAYNSYVKAFNAVREESDAGSDEMNSIYIEHYFNACQELYLSNKDKYIEQFLNDYATLLESCDKMMVAYKDNDEAKWKEYARVYNNIGVWFRDSQAGSVENLEKFFTPRVDSLKNDYEALKRIISLMINSNGEMVTSNTFYRACDFSYKLQPDYLNCIGKAQFAKNEFDDKDEALKFYKEAESVSTTPKEHYLSSMFVGMSLAEEKEPSAKTVMEWNTLSMDKKWELIYGYRGRQKVAAEKLDEAIDYGMQAGINGQMLSKLSVQAAYAYARAKSEECIGRATASLNQAITLYPAMNEVELSNARGTLENYRNAVAAETQSRIERQKQLAKNDAALKAYNERLAKQKAEEDFWKR